MYKRKNPPSLVCGIHLFGEVMNGKWKVDLLYYIASGSRRPGELQRKLPGATRRVLDAQLSQLTAHGLVTKTVFPQLPPKTEYHLTALGESLLPVITVIGQWSEANRTTLMQVLKLSQA